MAGVTGICKGCAHNNNGWCKKLKKNGLSAVFACTNKVNMIIDWSNFVEKEDGEKGLILQKVLKLLEQGKFEEIQGYLETQNLILI